MSKDTFSETITPLQAVTEGIQAIAPGLSLSKIFSDVKNELVHQASFGAHETAAALFNGSAFVMYGHGGKDVDQGQDQVNQEPERQQDVGREM